jgi:hypothetical protein
LSGAEGSSRLFHERGIHQLYRVPERFQLPRSVVRAAAGFHADQAWRLLGEERRYPIALARLPEPGLPLFIDAMHSDHVLCQIDTICRSL